MLENRGYRISCGCINDGNIWCTSYIGNMILKISVESKSIEYVAGFEQEPSITMGLYRAAESNGDNVIFIPGYAKNVTIFNCNTKSMSCINVEEYLPIVNTLRVISYYVFDNKLWLFPAADVPTVIIDLDSYEIETDDSFAKIIRDYNKTKIISLGRHLAVNNERIIYAAGKENYFIDYNLINRCGKLIELPSDIAMGGDIVLNNDEVWFSRCGFKGIGKYNIITNQLDLYDYDIDSSLLKKNVRTGDNRLKAQPFQNMILLGDYLWLLPLNTNCIVKFNIKNNKFEIAYKINGTGMDSECFDNFWTSLGSVVSGNKIFIMPYCYNRMIEIDTGSGNVSEFGLSYDKTLANKYSGCEDVINLQDYIDMLVKCRW